jgi:2-keto-4-pentenoate hydratase/2-oxohepta-3-ene-1,7-dioic acid hydratase in catechol pathway
MRMARFLCDGNIGYGVCEDGVIQPIAWEPFDETQAAFDKLDVEKVSLLAPVVPGKIIGIGLNYREHAEEVGMDTASEPTIFIKPPSSVLDPGGSIVLPARSEQVDYEGELAVIIGVEAKNVQPEDALDHVFGYTCGLDITARDLQIEDGQWTRAKGFDTFCPLGPWAVTDIDPFHLDLSLTVNGEERQNSNTSMMIFDVPRLVAFLSGIMTLFPGDVIMTGTPSGIGGLSSGDAVDLTISGIGTLSVSVA